MLFQGSLCCLSPESSSLCFSGSRLGRHPLGVPWLREADSLWGSSGSRFGSLSSEIFFGGGGLGVLRHLRVQKGPTGSRFLEYFGVLGGLSLGSGSMIEFLAGGHALQQKFDLCCLGPQSPKDQPGVCEHDETRGLGP